MTQQQMHELFDVDTRTLRNWKKSNRSKLFNLLETLDFDDAKNLLDMHGNEDLKRLLENEHYFDNGREFEKELYTTLVSHRDNQNWLKLSKDTSLSKNARMRAAYLYTFLTSKLVKLGFKVNSDEPEVSFFYKTRPSTGNEFAAMYGLKNGIDMMRFNQFKMTGSF